VFKASISWPFTFEDETQNRLMSNQSGEQSDQAKRASSSAVSVLDHQTRPQLQQINPTKSAKIAKLWSKFYARWC
jgi:hypothetical protein